jgi:hypothetical protein
VTAPKAWEMAATAGEEPVAYRTHRMLLFSKRRRASGYRAVLTKAYRWLLARLGLRWGR